MLVRLRELFVAPAIWFVPLRVHCYCRSPSPEATALNAALPPSLMIKLWGCVAMVGGELLKTNVIKVAHHGSRTSSIQDFINATKAKLAIISVGKHSPFGHPHEEVVERWRNSAGKVLTTGECGTISVSSGGKDLRLETFLNECRTERR